MGDKKEFVSYRDIVTDQVISEELDSEITVCDPNVSKRLSKVLELNDEIAAQETFGEIKGRKIESLYKELNDMEEEYNKQRFSEIIPEDVQCKEEIFFVKEKDKLDILNTIKDKRFIIDKIKVRPFGENAITTRLSVMIGEIDMSKEGDEHCIGIMPEFVLDAQGNVQPFEETMGYHVDIDEIKEFIMQGKKYTFLFG